MVHWRVIGVDIDRVVGDWYWRGRRWWGGHLGLGLWWVFGRIVWIMIKDKMFWGT